MPRILILAVVAIALLALAACGDDDEATAPTSPGAPAVTTQTPDSDGGSGTPIPNVCLFNHNTATDAVLILHRPSRLSEVTSPLIVTGEAHFEATLQIAIYDADGKVLPEASGMALQEEIGVSPFFIQGIEFTVAEPTPACLWVYEQSARDGIPINVGQVPLVLLP